MKNWERSEFDEQWKDVFAGAEVAPSKSVWATIDRELTVADNYEGKRRIVFYQRLAAACILFAVIAGTFGVYYWKQSEISVAKLNSGKSNEVANQSSSSVDEKSNSSEKSQEGKASIENKTAQLNTDETKINPQLNSLESEKNNLTSSKKANASNGSDKNAIAQSNTLGTTEIISTSETISGQNKVTSTNQPLENTVTQLSSEKTSEVKSSPNPPTSENAQTQQQLHARNSATEIKSRGSNNSTARGQNTVSDVASTTSTTTEKISGNEIDKVIAVAGKDESQRSARFVSNVDLPELEWLPTAKIEGEPRFAEIYHRLPYIPSTFMNNNREKKFEHEKLWASVTAASGGYTETSGTSYNYAAAQKVYNIALSQSSPPQLNNVVTPVPSAGTVPTVGKSYSYGVIGGVRLAERWVLQTGVQYMNQSMGNSTSQYANYGSGSLISTNEFVSVPVQAGYLLINRKIGWQLNPGLSTDFFVRNTLSNQQLSMSQGAGADSPYRSVNFAGLMSSEFSYKLGKNYRLSVVPGMRYSFNPALKSTTVGSAIAWDVGFRFRYIFK